MNEQFLGTFRRPNGDIVDTDQRGFLFAREAADLEEANKAAAEGNLKAEAAYRRSAIMWRTQALVAPPVQRLTEAEENALCGELGFHVNPLRRYDPALAKK